MCIPYLKSRCTETYRTLIKGYNYRDYIYIYRQDQDNTVYRMMHQVLDA